MRKYFPAWPRFRSAVGEISIRRGYFQLIWTENFCWWKLALSQDLVEIISPPRRDNFSHMNRPLSCKNDKAVKIMKKTQILLWKTIECNSSRRLRVRDRVRFLLFYSELAPLTTDPWCNMLRDFTWRKKYEEAMSDKHPHISLQESIQVHLPKLKRLWIDLFRNFTMAMT